MAMTSSERASPADAMSVLLSDQQSLRIRLQRLKNMLLIRRVADIVALAELFRRRRQPYPRPPLGDDNMFHRAWRMRMRNTIGAGLGLQ